MPRFDKLVRDRIPEQLSNKRIASRTRVLDRAEFAGALRKKLEEEIAEFDEAATAEERLVELADVLEVLCALGRLEGHEPSDLEEARRHKAEEVGAFQDRVLLIETD